MRHELKSLFSCDSNGVVAGARWLPSPNKDCRPEGTEISLVVIHGISLPPGEFGGNAVDAFFQNRLDSTAHPYFALISKMRVSAHFYIRRDGSLTQFVSCIERAWHAGESSWRGKPRCNDYSIGIELEGVDLIPYEKLQYATLVQLLDVLRTRYPITDIVGHCDIAPARKTDPGAAFDWTFLRARIALS